MKRLLLILVIIGLLIVGCDSGGDTPTTSAGTLKGALPILKIGDVWSQKGSVVGSESTSVLEVIGNDVVGGKDCYVLTMQIDHPSMQYATDVIAMLDEATLSLISVQYTLDVQGESAEIEVTNSTELSQSKFPVKVGKIWEVVETETYTMTVGEETETTTEENVYTVEVDAIETVTVPAGEFECFKSVRYDADGSLLETNWFSPEIKMMNVKTYDHETDETVELISYSVF